jgi:serine/threonine-protein kinase RsbW
MSEQQIMLKLTSHPRNISLVEKFVSRVATMYKVNGEIYGNMLISLTEAVNNAIIHGNQSDESKQVRIQLQKLKDRLAFHITDEGRGFDYHSIPDPTCPENIMKCGGRGVFLMHELSDSLSFRNNGSTVIIEFKI